MSNESKIPKHEWHIIASDEHSVTTAMEVGYGALVRNTSYEVTKVYSNEGGVDIGSVPKVETMTYVPNVKLVSYPPEMVAVGEEPEFIWVLEPHFPGSRS